MDLNCHQNRGAHCETNVGPDGANLGQHSHGTLKTGGVVSPTCNMVLEWPPAKHKENVATIGPEYRSHNNASGASNPILQDTGAELVPNVATAAVATLVGRGDKH